MKNCLQETPFFFRQWLIFEKAPVKWEPVDVTPILKDGKTVIPDEAIKSVKRNFVALKGPLAVYILILFSS